LTQLKFSSLAIALFWGMLSPLVANASIGLTLALPGEAVMIGQEQSASTSLQLPVGPYRSGELETLLLEGAMDKTTWRSKMPQISTLAMLQSLRAQVQDLGFEVLFECHVTDCGGFDFRFRAEIMPEPLMHVDLGDFRYLIAQRKTAATETLALMISRSSTHGFIQVTRMVATGAMQSGVSLAPNVPSAGDTAVMQPGVPEPLATRLGQGLSAVLYDLVFDSGSSVLSNGQYATLDALAAWLQQYPKTQVVIVGHTDASGSVQANLELSKMRAESVRQQLLFRYAVPPDQVVAQGVGQFAPRASNFTASGRAQNRRVEVIVTSTALVSP
jgi:OOP family OmpA-OmpF porin